MISLKLFDQKKYKDNQTFFGKSFRISLDKLSFLTQCIKVGQRSLNIELESVDLQWYPSAPACMFSDCDWDDFEMVICRVRRFFVSIDRKIF